VTPEERFDHIVHVYYQSLESGVPMEEQSLIDAYPEFEDELRSFFADLHHLKGFANARAINRDSDTEAESSKDTADLLPVAVGTTFPYIGQYRIVQEISRGGMGVVFKAQQERLGRIVALKMILSGVLASETEVDRFIREARSAARLKHPNIVGVHEIGVHQGHHYYTMDYIRGESLSNRLRNGSMTPRKAAELLRTLAEATHYAHTNGVLHRDLKPANILLDRSGQPHIIDFGLAKTLLAVEDETSESITQTGQILGTPSYMAPEQAATKQELIGVASDVYSLGAILYACLSGRAPFVAESTLETLRQVIESEPIPIREVSRKTPRDIELIVSKCLNKTQSLRYATAQELAADLTNFLKGKPVHAKPTPLLVKFVRWYQRNAHITVPLQALTMHLLLLVWWISWTATNLWAFPSLARDAFYAFGPLLLFIAGGLFFSRASFHGRRIGYWGNCLLLTGLTCLHIPTVARYLYSWNSLALNTYTLQQDHVALQIVTSGRAAGVFWLTLMLVTTVIQLHGLALETSVTQRSHDS